MLKVNDFFCGAGGMGLGFKQAGFRLAGAWDFDKYAVESYGQNVSPKVKQADIAKMAGFEIPYADVWTFGFPCQDISVAGRQDGMIRGETRSGLFYEIMRLLDEVKHKPLVIMAENVKAVKKYLPEIEKEYNAQGYKMITTLYNSKYWGVPQNRERYFIAGVHEGIERDFAFPEQQTDFVPKLSSILEDEVEDKYYLSDKAIEYMSRHRNGKPRWEYHKNKVEGVASTLTANMYKGVPYGVIQMVGTEDKKGVARKLTPRECARLQGFPDSFEFHVSNTQLYKQFGNAVTVNVSREIAKKIKEFLTISQS